MPAPTIPLSLPIANPTLKDVLSAWKTDIMLSTNCHGLATVQAVRTGSNGLVVVDATMNYSRTYYEKVSDGKYQQKQLDYPQMIDCPVVVLSGGSAALNMPVKQGDQCVILFNDRDMNNYFAGARSGPVASSRLHSFADAIALVGLNSSSFSFDADRAVLTDGDAKVGFNVLTDLLTLQNNSTSLNTVVTDIVNLISAIIPFTTAPPLTQAALLASATLINASVANLLE